MTAHFSDDFQWGKRHLNEFVRFFTELIYLKNMCKDNYDWESQDDKWWFIKMCSVSHWIMKDKDQFSEDAIISFEDSPKYKLIPLMQKGLSYAIMLGAVMMKVYGIQLK